MRYLIAIVLAAGALAVAGCGGSSSSDTTASTTTVATSPVTINVEVKGGKPVGGIQHATVKKGQTVAIVVHSDVADEVHVHGYDLHKDVRAGGTVRIAFPATITGVFEAELESRKLQIVEFTVE
jgi:hypothetical protein